MGTVKMTFYDENGKLVRVTNIEGQIFVEQFDWDGWYGYHCPVFVQINEERAIDMVIAALQVKHLNYRNRGRAGLKLYEFNMSSFVA